MTYDQAKEEVKRYMPDYLRSLGLSDKKPFHCLNPEHTDKNPSMSLNPKTNKVHCFSCGATYDLIDLIGMDYNLTDNKEKFKKAYELYNIQVDEYQGNSNSSSRKEAEAKKEEQPADQEQKPDYLNYYISCVNNLSKCSYLKDRGIPEEVAKKYLVGYDPDFKAFKALIIPTSKSSYVARNIDKKADDKNRYRNTGSSLLFNSLVLEKSKRPIFITEGEIDALSIISLGFEALGLGSTTNITRLIEEVKKQRPEAVLILALDNDEPGKKAQEKLKTELEGLKIYYYEPFDLYGSCKDANERLLSDKEHFKNILEVVEGLAKEAPQKKEEEQKKALLEEYKKANSASYAIQSFIDGIAENANTEYIKTGFLSLDQALEGGLYEGLYIVGAISSLGKTTLITQIGDQIAAQGQDVLIISLEMSKFELLSKSISRETFIECLSSGIDTKNAKTNRGISTGSRYAKYNKTEIELIKQSITIYSEHSAALYIQEGIGNIDVNRIRSIVDTHKEITGNSPVVIVDYLQILAPLSDRATDKQNTDKAVTELKRISRDYKIPVIAISSLNRNSYTEKISMQSFKESGAIEYSSDVLLGLQLKDVGSQGFNVDEAKKKEPREIELVILKNRNGQTGAILPFNYYQKFNYFLEVEEEPKETKKRRG